MSDGSISQDEIDALLSGSGGGLEAPIDAETNSAPNAQLDTFKDFVKGNIPGFSSNLGTMTGKPVSISEPALEIIGREVFLQKAPEMAVSAALPFEGSLTGEHVFILTPDFAKKLVSLVNHEDNVEIDDMGLAVISETMAQYAGTEATALDRAGLKGVISAPAESVHVPKAMLNLPQHNFTSITYTVNIDGEEYPLWEIIPESIINTISNHLNGGNRQDKMSMQDMQSMMQNPAQTVTAPQQMGMQGIPAEGGGMQMNMQSTPQMGMPNMGMPQMNMQQMGMPQPMMGGGSGIIGGNPNVQPVQFPPLQNFVTQEEQGNIGLIMDVYMEMTVELGRTKRTIREILGMGEGHIIELDKLAGEPVDILVNHKPIAKGEVVVIEENFGVRVTEILSPAERIADM